MKLYLHEKVTIPSRKYNNLISGVFNNKHILFNFSTPSKQLITYIIYYVRMYIVHMDTHLGIKGNDETLSVCDWGRYPYTPEQLVINYTLFRSWFLVSHGTRFEIIVHVIFIP